MAQHKAPTSISIAPVDDKSGLAEFVDRYWKIAVALTLAVVAGLMYRQHVQGQREKDEAQAWDKILQATSMDQTGMSGKVDDLVGVADQIRGTNAAPSALYFAAMLAAKNGKYDQAKSLLQRLRQEYPTSSVVKDSLVQAPNGPLESDVALLEARVNAQIAWRAQHPTLTGLPELPADAPKVKINTDRGSIVVGLYTDRAPHHAEAFLKLAREGSFNGMKFHRVLADHLIQSGDPNTRQEDVTTWGKGELGTALDPEPNALGHFSGALSSVARLGAKGSNASQFQILLADDLPLDNSTVVFGKVIEGLDTAKTISESKVAASTDRPEEPVTIQSTEVL
jgi:peptidyl-prolyl cis-trans isomerase B (cyclophilin B)